MLEYILENAGTIAVSLLLIGLVILIRFQLCNDKRKGKSTCGGNCGCCPMASSCHKKS